MHKVSILSLTSLALMSIATVILTMPADARTTLASCKRANERCDLKCTKTQIDVYDNIGQCKSQCLSKLADCHAKIVGNEASPNPGRPPKPKGPGSVSQPPKSNPTTPTKPKVPGNVTAPKSSSSSGGGGPILRSGGSGGSGGTRR